MKIEMSLEVRLVTNQSVILNIIERGYDNNEK